MEESSLEGLAEEYLKSLKVRNLSRRTIEGHNWMLARFFLFLNRLGIDRIEQINRPVIYDYQTDLYHQISKRGRPHSVWNQNNMLSAVKGFTRFLKERDYIISDPAVDVQYAKVPKTLPRSILTRSEARRIINAPDTRYALGYWDKTIMEVLYSTGIRRKS